MIILIKYAKKVVLLGILLRLIIRGWTFQKYLFILGMQSGTIDPASPWGLSLKEKLLPQYLKELGYKTHAIGKVSRKTHLSIQLIFVLVLILQTNNIESRLLLEFLTFPFFHQL